MPDGRAAPDGETFVTPQFEHSLPNMLFLETVTEMADQNASQPIQFSGKTQVRQRAVDPARHHVPAVLPHDLLWGDYVPLGLRHLGAMRVQDEPVKHDGPEWRPAERHHDGL